MRSNVIDSKDGGSNVIGREDSRIAMYLAEKTVGSDVIGGEDGGKHLNRAGLFAEPYNLLLCPINIKYNVLIFVTGSVGV